jgi:hypothetical protein
MNVELRVEELILQGFAPASREQIAAAVERELARLLAERGVPRPLDQGGDIAQVDGGSFTMTRDGRPEAIGAELAQAIYRGLGT